MYLPRSLASQLYLSLLKSCTPSSAPVLILPAASDPDALCATRILTALLKRDFIPHKIHPVGGYDDLRRVGRTLIKPMKYSEGGTGGLVVCLGVGGLVDLGSTLCLEAEEGEDGSEADFGGVEVWVFDKRRPWNLGNVFGGIPAAGDTRSISGVQQGKVGKSYRSGRGGIIVFDDGDIEEDLNVEKAAYFALADMPEVDDDDDESGSDSEDSDHEDSNEPSSKKRKATSDGFDGSDAEDDEERPAQRRRSNSGSSIASPSRRRSQSIGSDTDSISSPQLPAAQKPSAKELRRRFRNLRRNHLETLRVYYNLGTSHSEPVSSLMYSLAESLGREDNDLLWLALVGVSSLELSGHIPSDLYQPTGHATHQSWQLTRHKQIQKLFRDEVRRLNPAPLSGTYSPTEYSTKSSPSDSSIRMSPEPRLILLRHWSLYESMLHSPFIASRLHTWNDNGKKRLHKLLAKMGISLQQCKQVWTHMDTDLKKTLRERMLQYSAIYGIDGIIPTGSRGDPTEGFGFVKSWGWKASLSAMDVVTLVSAILDVRPQHATSAASRDSDMPSQRTTAPSDDESSTVYNFFPAYDALAPSHPTHLLSSLPLAQHLSRAILRTGTSLLSKNQIRHLRSFRMAVVKDGPDLDLFAGSVGALIKLATWIDQALRASGKGSYGKDDVPLVVAALDTAKGTYVVAGLGAGSNSYLQEEAEFGEAKRKEKEEKRKKKQEEREQKKKAREERKEIERRAKALDHDSADEDDETESEPSDSESESDDDDTPPTSPSSSSQADKSSLSRKRRIGNRFGHAFQEVSENTNAGVTIDHFDHCVVEVKKDDLGTFLEALSMACVVG